MLKITVLAASLTLSNLAILPAEAQTPAIRTHFFSCRAGLNNQEKNHVALVNSETPLEVLNFGYGITSRLRLLKSGALGIEVLHGTKVVSQMTMNRGVTQFAMTAGGIEMNCFPYINRDGL